jgi:hydroxyethylthiazole kinase-like uncharacterized protein yjeF
VRYFWFMADEWGRKVGLDKEVWGHKYCYGHALVLSGGPGRGGAGRLAARGALRVGAGAVTVGCPVSALAENAARLDAVMLAGVDSAGDLRAFLADSRVNALCLGPGLGLDRARQLVPTALEARIATVLDADALSAWAAEPEDLFRMLHRGCLLTPHWGEFRRIFPDLGAELEALDLHRKTDGSAGGDARGGCVKAAAHRCGCSVLLKGTDTWIGSSEGRLYRVSAPRDGSAAWLATAGSGDVLAGFCTGLMARGMEPRIAAEVGARLHLECGRYLGPGLIAEDLPEAIAAVLRSVGCGPVHDS